MAKKSSHGRQRQHSAQSRTAPSKPQSQERSNAATLVRADAETTPSAANVVANTAPATPQAPASAPKPATAPKSGATAVAQRPAGQASSREQNVRLARARATQRARTQQLIAPENYAYVLGDLRLVIGLAVTAFVVLIALTYVLPH